MLRNLTRVNTSQRKQEAASEREEEANEIENEITMLTKSHQETRDRLKSLKAAKTDLRKRKSSSKAESNSSGRVRTATSSLAKTSKMAKVALAAKISSKKSTSPFFFMSVYSILLLTMTCHTSRSQVNKRLVIEWQFDCQPNCSLSDVSSRATGLGDSDGFPLGASG